MQASDTVRQRLRGLKALEGPFVPVDFSDAGGPPQALFLDWLEAAIAADIAEPHAMTLSTADADGHPDARVLILKNVDDTGWYFAVSSESPKGRQIDARPDVALTFYWQKLGRQVRIRGKAKALDEATCHQDFLARSPDARASVLLERQSERLDHPSSVDKAMAASRGRIDQNPELTSAAWQVYVVVPTRVEFWQGATDRLHKRLLFQRANSNSAWERDLLWP